MPRNNISAERRKHAALLPLLLLTVLTATSHEAKGHSALTPPEPLVWAIDLRVAANVCVSKLSFSWGSLRQFNAAGRTGQTHLERVCGKSSGNGIGGYIYDWPPPHASLLMEWTNEDEVKCVFRLDIGRLADQSNPLASRYRLTIHADHLNVRASAAAANSAPRELQLPCNTNAVTTQ